MLRINGENVAKDLKIFEYRVDRSEEFYPSQASLMPYLINLTKVGLY